MAFSVRFNFLSKSMDENHRQHGEEDEEGHPREVSGFCVSPVPKSIPQSPEHSSHKHHHNSSVDDTIMALNLRAALRNGLEGSSEDASYQEESLQDDHSEQAEGTSPPHPAGEAWEWS